MQKKDFGAWAESHVAHYLENMRGWHLLGKNLHFREGELDLVMERDEQLYFVEVKARRSLAFGTVVESMTTGKVQRLRRAVFRWREREKDFRPGRLVFAGLLVLPDGRIELDLHEME